MKSKIPLGVRGIVYEFADGFKELYKLSALSKWDKSFIASIDFDQKLELSISLESKGLSVYGQDNVFEGSDELDEIIPK